MIAVKDIKAWLDTLDPEASAAVDDGGLTLIELDVQGKRAGMYLEVGGIEDGN